MPDCAHIRQTRDIEGGRRVQPKQLQTDHAQMRTRIVQSDSPEVPSAQPSQHPWFRMRQANGS